MRPGLIKDSEGEVLGRHDGAMTYTIGQRKGLGIEKPAADGKPRFVTGLDPATNTVTVGSRADLAVSHLTGIRTSWAGAAPSDMGDTPETGIDCEVQIRAHADPVPARAWLGDFVAEAPEHEANPIIDEVEVPAARPAGQLMHVDVDEELSGVAPGQTMVIYRGTRVLGQATIDSTAKDRITPAPEFADA